MTALYIDIETIQTQRQDVRDSIEEGIRDDLQTALDAVCAPANYKDESKIAEFCDGKRAAIRSEFAQKLEDKLAATGLDGAFGQVFCIGWATDGDRVSTIHGLDEPSLLMEFAGQMRNTRQANDQFTVTVIGHNVANFDLRFLTQRYIINGIRPPLQIARAAQAKPWETDKVYDTMVQWAGVGNRVSLDKLCLALSIPSPKGDFDGSQVSAMVRAGKHDEVARYCKRDVEAVREVHRRMTFAPALVKQFEDVPA